MNLGTQASLSPREVDITLQRRIYERLKAAGEKVPEDFDAILAATGVHFMPVHRDWTERLSTLGLTAEQVTAVKTLLADAEEVRYSSVEMTWGPRTL